MINIAKLNRSRAVERLAESVLETLGHRTPPIDVTAIAAAEGILLAESDYGPNFFGRIEYYRNARKFILYHPTLARGSTNYWQTRFSIAHELGHYYIPEHRKLLIEGKEHWSEPGFLCNNEMEREADLFASVLLIPDSAAKQLWQKNRLSIRRILEVSERCETSAVAAGIRAARGSEETAVIVLSHNSNVLFAAASEEAQARWFGWIGLRRIPKNSPSASAAREVSTNKSFEARVAIQSWYQDSSASVGCWEEAIRLGRTDLVLTLLIVDDEEEEED
jgi:hypothetical protein